MRAIRGWFGPYLGEETKKGPASAEPSPGTPGGSRTPDKWFRKPLLYPLSYRGGLLSEFVDSGIIRGGARSGKPEAGIRIAR